MLVRQRLALRRKAERRPAGNGDPAAAVDERIEHQPEELAAELERALPRAGGGFAGQERERVREIAAGEAEHVHEIGRQRAAVVEEAVDRRGDVLLVLIEPAALAERRREVQDHVLIVDVAQARAESGMLLVTAGELAAAEAGGGENGVGPPHIAAGREHRLHGAAERRRAGDVGAVGVGRRHLDQVRRRARHHQIALDRERADRRAGRERAAIVDHGVADRAVAAERAAGVDGGQDGGRDRAVHDQRAAVHVGVAAVEIDARQGERAGADLGEAAGARDRAREDRAGIVVAGGERRRSQAQSQADVAGTRERADGLIEAVEVERGAGGDRERAGRREGIRRAGPQGAGIDRGRAEIAAAARERQRADADLGEAAVARDRAREDRAGIVVAGGERRRSQARSQADVAGTRERADGLIEAVEVERGAGGDRERAQRREGIRRAGPQGAGIDRGRAEIAAAARERQRAGADLGEAAGARDRAREDRAGIVVAGGERRRSQAQSQADVAGTRERADGLIEAVEVERGAGGDRERAELREGIRRAGPQGAGIDRGRAGIGVGARERQRAGPGLGQRAAPTTILQNPGERRRQVVAAHREVLRAQDDSARALDRARRHAGICEER